jgi:hypothetical protein
MVQGEETDGTPTIPDPMPIDSDATNPDRDPHPTPIDGDEAPANADLNAGALSQPTGTGTP